MKRMFGLVSAIALTLAVGFGSALAQEAKKQDKPATPTTTATTGGATVGQPAPEFALKDTAGKDVKLGDFKGNVLVIEWSNHECPFCQRHAKENTAQTVLDKFKGKPVKWIGIDSTKTAGEKTAEIAAWAKENKITYPILIDAEGTIGKKFGAKTTPHVFVIDQKGTLVYAGAIDDDKMGTKEGARNYVIEAIEAVLNNTAVPTATTEPYGCSVKYKA
jgi:peroxiredoxin